MPHSQLKGQELCKSLNDGRQDNQEVKRKNYTVNDYECTLTYHRVDIYSVYGCFE